VRRQIVQNDVDLPRRRPFAVCQAPCLRWEAVAINKLRDAFDDGSTQAAVELDIDSEGHVLGGVASGRPRMVGKEVVETAPKACSPTG
jgi:hypothetical protein